MVPAHHEIVGLEARLIESDQTGAKKTEGTRPRFS
jgi:hypothetical protein